MRLLFLLLLLVIGHVGFAQTRDNEIRLLTGLHLGMDRAKIVSPGAAPFRTGPWFAGSLELGASVVHRNRWKIAASGAFAMNGYNLSLIHISEPTRPY